MSKIEDRLQELGIDLPEPGEPKFSYIPCNQTGNLLYLSGQDCRINGELMYKGKLGKELTIEQGQEAARQTIINCLAVLQSYLGDLDRVVKVVKLLGFVNSATGFADQPYVMNGASNLLVDVFGESGKHARSAIGTSELPFDTPVEIELIVEIQS
ncbi:enamine deaminase RidA (YjgF/YER057c/UK114 family) [Peribacillus deserti]|uniref:Enamine deaminase RidA (YjgF/YER057c/UK114 family) n=1 Tax=Peribacillus deserti TaxID=673318 RepID=A0ABS2QF14_9BACI|nr:RidA family protein [Peribacillus deserti]MBM7691745.1 enamine deaminase RidA (YjgF/YER057c/UK114 family) [Peribacillus deserti]